MQRGVEKARGALFEEFNLPEIIKFQRFIKLALGHILPPEKLKEIRKQAKSTVIDPGSESDEKEENLVTKDGVKIEIDNKLAFQSTISQTS